MKTLLILLATCQAVLAGEGWDSVCSPLVEDLGGGRTRSHYSGVWVSGAHWLTAKHCIEEGMPRQFRSIDGAVAKLVYTTNQIDGPAVFEVLPTVTRRAVALSPVPPRNGDTLTCHGYPGGSQDIQHVSGKMTYTLNGESHVSCRISPGYSGGAVSNSAGELVGLGLAVRSDGANESIVASWRECYIAMSHILPKRYPPISQVVDYYVWGDDSCGRCNAFKREVAANNLPVIYQEHIVPKTVAVPYFKCSTVRRDGYTGFIALEDWVRGTLRLPLSIGEAVKQTVAPGNTSQRDVDRARQEVLDRREALELAQVEPYRRSTEEDDRDRRIAEMEAQLKAMQSATPGQVEIVPSRELIELASPPEKTKPISEPIDWDGIAVVVAASTEIPSVAKIAEGPARRAVEKMSGGKARLFVIAESSSPDEFEQYQTAIGTSIDNLHVSILIPKSNLGLAKGLVAQKVEREIHDKLAHVLPRSVLTVQHESIFERTHSGLFHEVLSVAEEADAGRESSSDPFSVKGLLAAIIGLLSARYSWLGAKGFRGWLFKKGLSKITGSEAASKVVSKAKSRRS